MARAHAFDAHLQVANRWLEELSTNLQLAPSAQPLAVLALRAGLHAIRDRLPATEVHDLGAQLPTLIRGIYFEGWTLRNDPTRIRSREALIARVEQELRGELALEPIEVLRAVIQLLSMHVSAGEIDDVKSTLPRSIRALWDDVTDNEAKITAAKQRRRQSQIRHTGYSR